MAKAVIQANIQTQSGTVSVAPNAQIEIVDADTLSAVSLWEDRDGTVSKSNPFTADANGFFRVYANPGRVNITATLAGSSQTWNDVVLFDTNVVTEGQIGWGQTWQDVTVSRDVGVTYTNTTGRPILAIVSAKSNGTINAVRSALAVDGETFVYASPPTSTVGDVLLNMIAIIPDGSTYSAYSINNGTLYKWRELR